MTGHHTMHIRVFNAHAVLPRILLGFSRRRLRVQALQFSDVSENEAAELQIDFEADAAIVDDLVKQLTRIVEVQGVRSEPRATATARSRRGSARAA